jgi:hypothetical protein
MISRSEYDQPIVGTCFLCNKHFRDGPGAYGKYVRQWDITVCSDCYRRNQEGIVPDQNHHLLEHLNTKGIKIKLNDRGWLDWPPY